jgi:hypothetical protein
MVKIPGLLAATGIVTAADATPAYSTTTGTDVLDATE